jgi:hypothetical protein
MIPYLTVPNLLVILSLISFLSIILGSGSPLKSYTNFYENNNHILLKFTPIYAQGNSGDFEDGNIFPDFKAEDDGAKENGGDIFPDFNAEDEGAKENGGGGDGAKENGGGGDGAKENGGGGDGAKENGGLEKEGGNEERINENTNDFNPLSSASPINPYGSPTNTDDKVNPDEVGQPVGQQSEQEYEDQVQVDQQTVGNEVNQTEQQTVEVNQTEQQTVEVNQTEQQTVGNEVNQTEQQTVGNEVNQTEQQTVGNEVNQTEQQQQQQDIGKQVDQQLGQQP